MSGEIVIAVIVTFNPDDGLAQRIKSVAEETSHIIVVDNASSVPVRTLLNDLQRELPQLECIWNDTNMGLATALNQGITRALEKGATWVLLLDHDSHPQPGMVATMLRAYTSRPKREQIALVAPNISDDNSAVPTRYLMPGGKFGFRRVVLDAPINDEAFTVITSGSLVKAAIFRDLGLMPESFFIDCIDHAFCLRLKERGMNILLVKDAALRHRLGEKKMHSLAGATVITSNHSSLRRYYIFRNRVWIWKRFGRRFPGFLLHDLLASGYDVFRVLAYENQKWPKLKAMAKGIIAGLTGQSYLPPR